MCHPRDAFDSPIATSASGLRYGNGRSNSARTQLKIVAFTPMPSARQRTAAIEKAGFLISVRTAYLKSCSMVGFGGGGAGLAWTAATDRTLKRLVEFP